MVEKHGKFPANARVDVDYSKGKPKIKFAYPDNGQSPKKQARKQNGINPFTLILLLILIGVIYLPYIFYVTEYKPSPSECNLSEDFYEVNSTYINHITGNETNLYLKSIRGYNITCNTGEYKIIFQNYNEELGYKEGFYNDDFDNSLALRYLLLWVLLPIIIFFIVNHYLANYLVKQEWYQRWLPKHQANGWFNMMHKKYKLFKPEDVENNMVEIPMFSNVELDYKTFGDFDKYLDKIKIREHRHYKWKKGKISKKEEVNVYKWYARFFFKEKPKTGYMEVIYQ